MWKITTIYCEAFKSFSRPVEIELDSRFTSVIGPNGSGKSAILDALQFCLGVSNKESLRGNLASYVNDNRRQQQQKASAFVGITLQSGCDIVLAGRRVKLTTKDAKSDYMMMRKKADGEGEKVSPAELLQAAADNVCKKEEYMSALAELGFDIHSIDRLAISQKNRIAQVLSGPHALLKFVERIARTEELMEKIEAMSEEVERLSSEAHEAGQESRRLTDQMETLKPVYQDAVRLHHMYTRLIARLLRAATEQSTSCAERAAQCQSVLETSKDKEEAATDLYETQRKALQELDKERVEKEKALKQADNRVKKLQQDLRVKKDTLYEHEAQHEAHEKEVKRAKELYKSKSKELQDCKKQLKDCQQKYKHTQTNINTLAGRLDIGDGPPSEAVSAYLDAIKRKRQYESEVQSSEAECSHIEQQIQDVAKKEEKANAQLSADGMKECEESQLRSVRRQYDESSQQMVNLEARLKQLEGHVAAHGAGSAGAMCGKWEEGVKQLRGTLCNAFIGPLRDTGACNDASVASVIESVISWPLRHCVVVRQRNTAIAVVKHFQQNKLGQVKCVILDEYRSETAAPHPLTHNNATATPLMTFIDVESPDLTPIWSSLVNNWYLVESVDDALVLQKTFRGKNFITRDNEIFRGDGEIMACGRPGSGASHRLLRVAENASAASADGDKKRPRVDDKGAGHHQQQEEMQKVKKALADVRDQRSTLMDRIRGLEELSQKRSALQRQIDSLVRQKRGLVSSLNAQKKQTQQQMQLVNDATKSIDEAKQRLPQSLHQRGEGHLAEYATHLAELESIEEQQHRLEDRTRLLQTSFESLKQKVSASSGGPNLNVDLDKLNTDIQDMCNGIQDASCLKSSLTRELSSMEKRHDDLATKADKAKSQLASLRKKIAKSEAESAALAEERETLTTRLKKLRHAKMNRSTFIAIAKDNGLEGDPEDWCAARGGEGDEADGGDVERDDEQDDMEEEEEEEEEHIDQDTIQEDTIALAKARDGLDCDALGGFFSTKHEMAIVSERMESLQQRIEHKTAERQAMADQRHTQLVQFLSSLNDTIQSFYKVVNNQGGRVLIEYSSDAFLLNAHGVQIMVKPEANGPWRALPRLSMGQQSQAIACLSLACSILGPAPIPSLFCDELDASMDSVAVGRLCTLFQQAETLKQLQLVVITHRPHMYEQAKVIIGVYGTPAGSCVARMEFEEAGEEQNGPQADNQDLQDAIM
ncbi:unnamed protein product [Vitrella brassicaformis CCMP3155]|uniref:Structural maintenance of chromosomes protein n=3 Tax=Vitrella brassicaformis TaxID=1169539 RepID=A0A0G4EB34_VITBC|nr:unnamed protein product [Vitrella brassicaformis CCMP3155]|eukprot:CEL92905.1 unnamed protein product [Vitrella brassicaformis CCMP3155]